MARDRRCARSVCVFVCVLETYTDRQHSPSVLNMTLPQSSFHTRRCVVVEGMLTVGLNFRETAMLGQMSHKL